MLAGETPQCHPLTPGSLTLMRLCPVLTLCDLQCPWEDDARLGPLPGQVLGGALQPWGHDSLRTE